MLYSVLITNISIKNCLDKKLRIQNAVLICQHSFTLWFLLLCGEYGKRNNSINFSLATINYASWKEDTARKIGGKVLLSALSQT